MKSFVSCLSALRIQSNLWLSFIKDPDAKRLARELAAKTGESPTEAVVNSLRERLARLADRNSALRLRDELRAIRERCKKLPVLDPRTPDQILGYDDRGLPH